MAEYVVIVTLPGTMEHFTKKASGRLTIGRTDDCDIWLAHPTVSRLHAEISVDEDEGRFVVRDVGSRNGTTVNGQALKNEEAVVKGKASIQIGPYILTLLNEEDMDETITVVPQATATPRFKLDRGLRALVLGDKTVIDRLSGLEYRLLDTLDASAPNVVTNTSLGDHLWGEGQWDIYMLHNLIRRIRRKLEEADVDPEEHLMTVTGVGYRLA